MSVLEAKATLEDKNYVSRTREVIAGVKTVLITGLERIGVGILPTHRQVPISVAHVPTRNLFHLLASQGILTGAGSSYRLTYEPFDDSFVRVRVPANEDTSRELVERVSRVL